MSPSSLPTAVVAVINGIVYTEKMNPARTADDCPMEKALRFVERHTKSPRENWESRIGHPFVRAANALAKRLAGVNDKPKPYAGRGFGRSKPTRCASTAEQYP